MNILKSNFTKIIVLAGVIALFSFFKSQQGPAVKSMTPAAYKEQVKAADVLVDVRTPEEFQAGHVKGAELSDFKSGQFAEQIKKWDKTKTYYLYCASGNRSGKAAKLMQDNGFKHVYNLGAFNTLQEAGLPTTQIKE